MAFPWQRCPTHCLAVDSYGSGWVSRRPGVTPPPGTPPGATIEAHFGNLVVTQQ